MRATGLERAPQRRTGTEQMLLADKFIERSRPQPIGQRPIRAIAGFFHGASRPITSTPAGTVNVNRSAGSTTLRRAAENFRTVT